MWKTASRIAVKIKRTHGMSYAWSMIAAVLCAGTLAIAEPNQATVFKNGEDGYKIFRIPAVVLAANGHLLAFCEARTGGDASEIDLVMKRSLDGGKSWGLLEVVQESDSF